MWSFLHVDGDIMYSFYTCRLYSESEIDFFLHVSRSWTCVTFGYM